MICVVHVRIHGNGSQNSLSSKLNHFSYPEDVCKASAAIGWFSTRYMGNNSSQLG